MMEATEWPTEKRLLQLRRDGKVPFSPFASRCVGLATVLLLVGIQRGQVTDWVASLRAQVLVSNSDNIAEYLISLLSNLAEGVLIVAVSLLVILLFVGLLQNRFLFRLGAVAPRWDRLNPFSAWRLDLLVHTVALRIALLLVTTIGAFVLARLALPWALGLLNRDQQTVQTVLWEQYPWISVGAGVLLCFVAGVAVLVRRYFFLREHRMTRQEVEREGQA